VPVPPEQVPKPLCVQTKVQVLKSATVWLVTGSVPLQKLLATVAPSLRVQVTVRVWVAVASQVLEEADQLPGIQV
jgi:hypothetical protein